MAIKRCFPVGKTVPKQGAVKHVARPIARKWPARAIGPMRAGCQANNEQLRATIPQIPEPALPSRCCRRSCDFLPDQMCGSTRIDARAQGTGGNFFF